MKTVFLKSAGSLLILITACFLQVSGQNKKNDNAALQKALDTKHFVFVAQTVTPLRGGVRQLTSQYDLTLSGDTVISSLPYFGRAYVAPMNPSESGLSFTTTTSDYRVKLKKKGAREIGISTKAAGDNQRMQLTVFSNGTASLQVTSNNRDAISFTGYVQEIKKR
ncbi:MAG: DUF4251 domain-containing protein [Williamsia sp.]|nr:DUF4251 domain-containing protein [Williamsia sp.]